MYECIVIGYYPYLDKKSLNKVLKHSSTIRVKTLKIHHNIKIVSIFGAHHLPPTYSNDGPLALSFLVVSLKSV
jgi:hypothetical protein